MLDDGAKNGVCAVQGFVLMSTGMSGKRPVKAGSEKNGDHRRGT
jgi:hypothetical protein